MKGRKPKPLEIHKLHGTIRKRHGRAQPSASGEPEMPNHLDEVGQVEWARVVIEMRELGTLHSADRATIAAHASTYSHLVQAERELQKSGMVIETPTKMLRPSPWLKIFENATAALRQFAAELGLSPVSRTRLQRTEPSAERESKWHGLLA